MVDYETFQKEWDDDIGEDGAREFEQWKKGSEMLRWLRLRRISAGYTEKEIADILGWTEDQVLTFEMSEFQNVHVGNLLLYLTAINVEIGIRFVAEKATPEDSIAFHADSIYDLFKKVVEVAGDDKKRTKEALELIYAYSQMVTTMIANLTAMFSNDSAVIEALEEILPPKFKPSQNIREDDTDISDYEISIVAGAPHNLKGRSQQLSFSSG